MSSFPSCIDLLLTEDPCLTGMSTRYAGQPEDDQDGLREVVEDSGVTLNGPRQSGLRAVDLLEGVTRTAGCAASGASLSVLLLAVRANQAEEFI